jgi:hypothetical protein
LGPFTGGGALAPAACAPRSVGRGEPERVDATIAGAQRSRMKATSSRRRLIVYVLLGLAVAGAAMRQWAPDPSLARDVGTLLLVLWLPVIGQVVGFVIARVQAARAGRIAAAFAPDAAFTPQLEIEFDPVTAALPALPAGERHCTLVVGHEGFTARAAAPLAQWLGGPRTRIVALQLLRPALALQRLGVGTTFSMLAGRTVVGTGRVLQVHQPGHRQ